MWCTSVVHVCTDEPQAVIDDDAARFIQDREKVGEVRGVLVDELGWDPNASGFQALLINWRVLSSHRKGIPRYAPPQYRLKRLSVGAQDIVRLACDRVRNQTTIVPLLMEVYLLPREKACICYLMLELLLEDGTWPESKSLKRVLGLLPFTTEDRANVE